MTYKPEIVELLPEHAYEVAKLHISGIGTGFISSLGLDFVTAMYEAIARSKYGIGLVALRDNEVMGFAAFTTNLGALYKSVILCKGFRFASILAGRIISIERIKKVLETLFYPGRVEKSNLPKAELLSIVVSENERSKGLGKELLRKGFEQCREKGIEKIKVLVGAENEPANKVYLSCGFDLVDQIDNHGIKSNIYVVRTDHFAQE